MRHFGYYIVIGLFPVFYLSCDAKPSAAKNTFVNNQLVESDKSIVYTDESLDSILYIDGITETYKAASLKYYHAFERVEENLIEPKSYLKEGEKLEIGQSYFDTLEYIACNEEGDFPLLTMKSKSYYLDFIGVNNLEVNRGDVVLVECYIDTLRPVGDSESLWAIEHANIRKVIREGKLTQLKKKYPEKISYNIAEDFYHFGWQEGIEYYLANQHKGYLITDPLEKGLQLYITVGRQQVDNQGEEKLYLSVLVQSFDGEDYRDIQDFLFADGVYKYSKNNNHLLKVFGVYDFYQ